MKELQNKHQIVEEFGQSLVATRKNMMKHLEQTINVDSQGGELLYTQKLSQFIQNFIQNQDQIDLLSQDNVQINGIIQELNQELDVPKQFCLDFSSL